ncbi:DNA-binding transcriptional MerR regulator [Stackebrandtia albiflava]|uniref:DNA-binding transcriptional MerR regulator n=1 Tax=Stackebrandtia albiflava TaxID=406432 RepID=A0A562UPV4_9ACTN|nr:MerR family transcriptional regulator [Stackebrandtia albiflava]TWJ07626.1 DNA-binding transcriptional MerR regulator [Stackebrandtia albiflava]
MTVSTTTSLPAVLMGRTAASFPRPDGEDHYTIGEVAEMTGLSAHTLRWYERIGLLPDIDRSHHGRRRFRNPDLARIRFITNLRLTGMPVADMIRYAELVRAGDHTAAARAEMLTAHRDAVRAQIARLGEAVAVLDFKIDNYRGACAPECGA